MNRPAIPMPQDARPARSLEIPRGLSLVEFCAAARRLGFYITHHGAAIVAVRLH